MAIKRGNEITVRVKCSQKELFNILKQQDFKELNQYYSNDIFMVPESIDIYKQNSREILKRAILLREFDGVTTNKHKTKITYKNKEFDDKGNILSQYSVNCEITNINDAKELFEHLGYKEIMEISETHYTYEKNNFRIIIKIISKDNILIEAELNDYYKSIKELIEEINKCKIPFDKSNYFVKKAEEELDKKKRNKE